MNFRSILKHFIFLLCFFMACTPSLYHYTDYYDMADVKKVAVFPFSNLSQYPWASEIVTQIFVAELAKRQLFVVEEPGNILEFMIERRIKIGTSIDPINLLLLRRRYGVDAVILGEILAFNQKGGVPYLELSMRMVSTKDAKVIWKVSIERSGEDYVKFLNLGLVRSLPQLTQRAVDELIKTIRMKEILYAMAKKEKIKRRVRRAKKRLTKVKPAVIRHKRLQSVKKKNKKISKRVEKRFTMLASQKPIFFKKRETKAIIDPCKGERTIKIRFDFDSAFFEPAYYSNLEKVGRCLKKYPWERAIIAGYTDNIGSEIYNIKLSLRRAETIKDFFLKRFNLSPYQTVIIGYGERYPIADNATVDGRAKNRRVEITVRIK